MATSTTPLAAPKRTARLQDRVSMWEWLHATPWRPTASDRKQQRTLLTWVLACLGCVLVFALLIAYSEWRTAETGSLHQIVALAGLVAAFPLLNALSKGRHTRLASTLLVVLGGLTVFVVAIPSPGNERSTLLLAFLVVPILLSSILLSVRLTGLSAAGAVILCCANYFIAPWSNPHDLGPLLAFILSVGLPISMFMHVRDEQEKRRRVELAASEERYRVLVELSPNAIVVIHEDVIAYANQAALKLGSRSTTSKGTLVGRSWHEFVHPREAARLSAFASSVSGALLFEQHAFASDGTEYLLEIAAAPVEFDRKPAWQIIARDITERKQSDAQALELKLQQEHNLMLERFIGDASHDLKTPITAMLTTAYVIDHLIQRFWEQVQGLAGRPDITSSQRETINELMITMTNIRERQPMFKRSAKRLQDVLEGMLDLVRLDNRSSLSLTSNDVNLIISHVVQATQEEAQIRRQTLTFIPDPAVPRLLLAQLDFSRAVQNLVENALHYTADGGTVEVVTCCRVPHVVLEVRDTGIGIPPEDLPHIFDRFFRSENARAAHNGGTGLGLAIVRKVVEAHGGVIEVDSELGKGTTFRVLLPNKPLEHIRQALSLSRASSTQ